jgi:hypothetical protein
MNDFVRQFTLAEQQQIIDLLCKILLVSGGAQQCLILRIAFPSRRSRKLLEEIMFEQIHLAAESAVIDFDFELKYYLENYPGLNATYLAQKSQDDITTSFVSGEFQASLREEATAANITQLFNATSTTVTTEATIITPETAPSSHSVSLTAGQVAGIVIGSIIGAILIFVLIFFLVREKRSDSRISQASRYASNNALDRNLGDLVVVDEQHSPTRLGAPRNDTSGYIDDTVTIHVDHDIERQVVGGGGGGEESTDLTDGYLQIRL